MHHVVDEVDFLPVVNIVIIREGAIVWEPCQHVRNKDSTKFESVVWLAQSHVLPASPHEQLSSHCMALHVFQNQRGTLFHYLVSLDTILKGNQY